jgi:GNAT superfamily N-acetyltransferase
MQQGGGLTAVALFPSMSYPLRPAVRSDLAALQVLIERSVRVLGARDYRPEQLEAALRGAFGVDTQLIDDGTYFVATSGERLVGCGGWSYRRTLFGSDARAGRDAAPLDPRVDAAKIRAFFVDPDCARQGIGRALLERCEQEARAHRFWRFELMGTLPGVRLYEALGYRRGELLHYPVGPGVSIEFIPMHKALEPPAG